jgi:DNA-nicking Smr family endonuclease
VPAPAQVPAVQRRQARRIASGRIEIEARLDLHGLTQSAAHGRLASFLASSAAAGLKTVLVITGKGGRASGGEWASEDPGVLRRNVPRWLGEAALRPFVESFAPAARQHGGEGAFYVLLRRRRGRGQP